MAGTYRARHLPKLWRLTLKHLTCEIEEHLGRHDLLRLSYPMSMPLSSRVAVDGRLNHFLGSKALESEQLSQTWTESAAG